MTFRRLCGRSRDPDSTPRALLPEAETDDAWKALSLVVDWIKHAEAKAGAVLAASGVAGGVLYNLVKSQSDSSLALNIAAGGAVLFLLLATSGACLALWPRLRAKEPPTSSLYYSHIARAYPKSDGSRAYSELLVEVASDRTKLIQEIAGQVWVNAHVANAKYTWINRAMTAFLLGLVFLAAVPVLITLDWAG